MKNLLDQHRDALSPLIRDVDHAAREVDRREADLGEAEQKLDDARKAMNQAIRAFLEDFPEIAEIAVLDSMKNGLTLSLPVSVSGDGSFPAWATRDVIHLPFKAENYA